MSTRRTRLSRSWLVVAALAIAIAGMILWARGRSDGNGQPPAAPAVAVTVREYPPPGTGEIAPPAAGPTPQQAPPAAPSSAAPSEEVLMRRLREAVDARPSAALELARDAERLYPGGRDADERSFLKMRALVHLGDISGAREEAYRFYERNPASPYAERVHRLTGLRPIPGPPGRR